MSDIHPDDEYLSALVDDEAAPDVIDHVRGCPTCRDRVDRLEALAAMVAAPPSTPDSANAEVAVAAALRAAAEPVTSRVGRPTGRGRLPLLAAASLAVIVGIAALLGSRGNGGHRTAAALRSPAGGAVAPGPGVASGGDLGSQTNTDELRRTVERSLPAAGSSVSSATGPSGAQAATDAAGASLVPCLSAARVVAGPASELLFQATLRWRGAAAVVLVFSAAPSSSGSLSRQLLVLDGSTCAVDVAQRF